MAEAIKRDRSAKRVFRCHECDHKLRLGVAKCGSCWAETPLYNRWSFYIAVIVLIAAIAAIAVLANI